jgi:hypothetical protein
MNTAQVRIRPMPVPIGWVADAADQQDGDSLVGRAEVRHLRDMVEHGTIGDPPSGSVPLEAE